METIAGGEAIVQAFGGYEEAEKCRLYISLEWENLRPEDYQVQLFEIEYAQKFASLRHSQISGAPANSGVKTDTFGDIITDGKAGGSFSRKKNWLAFSLPVKSTGWGQSRSAWKRSP